MSAAPTRRFDPTRHDAGDFVCGQETLDRWLARYAARNQRSDAARTFVAVAPDGRVRGYYTLLAGEVERTEATEAVRRGLSRHFPVPVAILARLAVDRRDQGEGLGAALLDDALRRVRRAAEDVAVRAVVVHGDRRRSDPVLRALWLRPLPRPPRTLMVTLAGACAPLVTAGWPTADAPARVKGLSPFPWEGVCYCGVPPAFRGGME